MANSISLSSHGVLMISCFYLLGFGYKYIVSAIFLIFLFSCLLWFIFSHFFFWSSLGFFSLLPISSVHLAIFEIGLR